MRGLHTKEVASGVFGLLQSRLSPGHGFTFQGLMYAFLTCRFFLFLASSELLFILRSPAAMSPFLSGSPEPPANSCFLFCASTVPRPSLCHNSYHAVLSFTSL